MDCFSSFYGVPFVAWHLLQIIALPFCPCYTEIGSDGCYPPGSKAPQIKKTSPLEDQASKASLGHVTPASAARRRTSLGGNGTKTSPPMFRKLDCNKPTNVKLDIAAPTESFVTKDVPLDGGDGRYEKKNLGGVASVVVSNETGDICRNQRDCEDLSLIRKQLVQIENQQSHLLDLLQVLTSLPAI